MAIEILVAISIISISVLAAMAVAQQSIYVSRQALHMTQAAFLLEEGAEAVRIMRDNSWNSIASKSAGVAYYPVFSNGTWGLSENENTVGIFTRKAVFANVNRNNTTKDISTSGTNDSGTKLITISVSWDERGKIITKNLPFYMTDIFYGQN